MVLMSLTLDITTPEEMETEQKFDDGMLAKLSKITDLMSRLETYDGIADGDRKRVQSPISQYPEVFSCMYSTEKFKMKHYHIVPHPIPPSAALQG